MPARPLASGASSYGLNGLSPLEKAAGSGGLTLLKQTFPTASGSGGELARREALAEVMNSIKIQQYFIIVVKCGASFAPAVFDVRPLTPAPFPRHSRTRPVSPPRLRDSI